MSLEHRRILLVAGILPCSNYSGGLFLQQIIRMTVRPAGIFAVQNPQLQPVLDPALQAAVPTRVLLKPNEGYRADQPPGEVRRCEWEHAQTFLPAARDQLLAFAREIGATDIWCVLEGQTLIRLAHSLLGRLQIPLRVQVMDPPGWWLRAHRVDAESSREVMEGFEAILRGAQACATASWAMAQAYRQRHGAVTSALVPALEDSLAVAPAEAPSPDMLRVGFAGQTYAAEEFASLQSAMRAIAGTGHFHCVELHAFTASVDGAAGDGVLQVHPWRAQSDLVRQLSAMDLLYCPYWFSAEMREEANLSFPSKLTTYLAAGRPVVFHGRADSSPGRFLRRGGAGFFCFRPGADAIWQTLERSLVQARLYAETARNGRRLFDAHLNTGALRRSFSAFMEG